ncbi:MAG: tripartite tricarboxylate transporter TctB family protein [Sneathiella sp.]|nr:tripartite tricarboxylate transporter TctB family protein [Sneathiella sp.]
MQEAKTSTIVAAVLLTFCAVMIGASYDIRDLGFDGLPANAWPRFIIVALAIVSLIYLIQSIFTWRKEAKEQQNQPSELAPKLPLSSRLSKFKNPLWCFILFGAFLGTLDFLGMLIGGILFTFTLLSILGGWEPRKLMMHACVSVISIGFMWSVFTFGLRVFLPQGEILGYW